MDQFRNENHKFSVQNTQHLDITRLLQDEAFENVFFSPNSMDYNPMNFDELHEILYEEKISEGVDFVVEKNMNEYIDLNKLHELLNEEKGSEGVHSVAENEGGTLNGSSGSNMVATQINKNGDELMNVKLTGKQNIKRWTTKKRVKMDSKEAAQMKELKRIKNRVTAARAFAEKKAYIQWLELEVQKFRQKNANLKKLLLFSESSLSLDMTWKQLKRTGSGPM